MAIEHHFYMDTPASRHALRDALVRAGIGLEAAPDLGRLSRAFGAATNASIVDDLSGYTLRPDNGVVATRRITFRDRKAYLSRPALSGQFERQTVLGVMALLKAYPGADAYWLAYDAERPVLLRRGGRLVLSKALTEPGRFWDTEDGPPRALVDLPHVVEPLGPWEDVPVAAQGLDHRLRPTVR